MMLPGKGKETSSNFGRRTKTACGRKTSNKTGKREKRNSQPPVVSKNVVEESEGTLNLVSDTLLSVAKKINKVFTGRNSSDDKRQLKRRPKIKRIYVVRFKENNPSSKSIYCHQQRTARKMKRGEMKETIHKEEESRAANEKGESSVCSGIETADQIEHHLASDNAIESDVSSLMTSDEPHLWRSHKLRGNRISSQNGDCMESSGNEFNYRILYRGKSPPKARIRNSGIADVFQAMVDEMDSIERRKINSRKQLFRVKRKKKRLDQILDDNESIVTSDYDIPSEMVSDEGLARLQVLIDYAKRRAQMLANEELESYQEVDKDYDERIKSLMDLNNTTEMEDITSSSSIASGPICRICHSKQGILVKPCKCRGSLAYVHIECLQVWLTEKDANSCELCNYVYKIIHTPRNCRLIPSLGFWYKFSATSQQRKALLMDITLGVVLLPLLIFFAAFVRYYTDETYFDVEDVFDDGQGLAQLGTKIALKVVLFLVFIAYLAGIVVRANNHFSAWMSWFISKNVTVVLDEPTNDDTPNER